MGAEVRAKEGGVFVLEVVGHGEVMLFETVSEDGGETVEEYVLSGTEEGVGPASLESLRQALLTLRQGPYDATLPIKLILSDAPEGTPASFESIYDSPSLLLDGERLFVRVATSSSPPPDPADLRRLFAPFLKRHGASCHNVVVERESDPFGRGDDEFWSVEVIVDWPIEGRIVADAWSFGEEAYALLRAVESGELTQANALDLLRGGREDLFLEQPESEWLDAKAAPYKSAGEAWKRELAKDIAAFANRPGGGVIVLGMKTRPEGDLDVIDKLNGIDPDLVSAETYRKAIRQWVYPEVTGLEIETIPASEGGREFVALVVPPQPRSSFPFLVQGVLLERKVEGDYILLPFRRAAHTASGDIAGIHSRIRLGQQVLDAERRPPSPDD